MATKKKMADKSDKRRRAKVVVGHQPDGTPIVKYASGRTAKELEEAKEELRRQYVSGDTLRRKDLLFEVYAKEWYELYKRPHIGQSSRQTYATMLNKHLFPYLAGRQLRAITASDLQAVLNGKDGSCVAIISYTYTILRGIFGMAYANGLIDRDPTVSLRKPKAEKDTRRALTAAETAAALQVARSHKYGLLLHLLYYTGMRLGEACAIQWKNVDFKRRIISVDKDVDFHAAALGDVKTPSSVREIPMPDDLVAILAPLRGIGDAFVFPGPDGGFWKNSSIHRAWTDLAREMYLADTDIEGKKTEIVGKGGKQEITISVLTAHYFRHNYASLLYNAGVDVLAAQKILGHKTPKTTLEIYAHISDSKMKENNEKIKGVFERGCQTAEMSE